jgi:hypothetical protein
MMVDTDLSATKPGEKGLRLVRACAIMRICFRMIDALYIIKGV